MHIWAGRYAESDDHPSEDESEAAWLDVEVRKRHVCTGSDGPAQRAGEPARHLGWMAAIISRSNASSNYVRLTRQARAIGFVTLLIPASLPSQYPSRRAMVAELFGCSTVRDVPRLTAYEIALLLSHKRALAAIASSRFDWGVVFEEDATLHPSVRPKQARQLLRHTLAFAGSLGRNLDDLFLFLGACSAHCDQNVTQEYFGEVHQSLLRGGHCRGYCAHAYAMSRRRAGTLFHDLYCAGDEAQGHACGQSCYRFGCYFDWAIPRFLTHTRTDSWILGGGVRGTSGCADWGGNGIFVQNRSLQRNKFQSTLRGRDHRWPKIATGDSCEAVLRGNETLALEVFAEKVVPARPPPLASRPGRGLAESVAEHTATGSKSLRCLHESHVWVTVTKTRSVTAHAGLLLPGAPPPLCHEHLEGDNSWLPAAVRNIALGRGKGVFWRLKWQVAQEYLLMHRSLEVMLVTDVFDVYINPFSADTLLRRFNAARHTSSGLTEPPELLFAAEDSCWIGMTCSEEQVARFHTVRQAAGWGPNPKFMHSQFMGTRAGLLHLFNHSLVENKGNDMNMMFRYSVAFPRRVALDVNESIFAVFARPRAVNRPTGQAVRCFAGWCVVDGTNLGYECDVQKGRTTLLPPKGGHHRATITPTNATIQPIMWHVNGHAELFLKAHRGCSFLLEAMKRPPSPKG